MDRRTGHGERIACIELHIPEATATARSSLQDRPSVSNSSDCSRSNDSASAGFMSVSYCRSSLNSRCTPSAASLESTYPSKRAASAHAVFLKSEASGATT